MHIQDQSRALDIGQDSYQSVARSAIAYERDGATLIAQPVDLSEAGERWMVKIREPRGALTQGKLERRHGGELVAQTQNFQTCLAVETRPRAVTATQAVFDVTAY